MYNSNTGMPETSGGPGYEHSGDQTGYHGGATEQGYASSSDDSQGFNHSQSNSDDTNEGSQFDQLVEEQSKPYQGQEKATQQDMRPKDDQNFFINQELMHEQEEKREHKDNFEHEGVSLHQEQLPQIQDLKPKKNSIEAMIDDAIEDAASR